MKCVCNQTCQTHVGKNIMFFEKGDVQNFEVCPLHFSAIEDDTNKAVDYENDSEAVLMELKWEFNDAAEFVSKNYGITLAKGPKADVVGQIIDARYRSLDGVDLNKMV